MLVSRPVYVDFTTSLELELYSATDLTHPLAVDVYNTDDAHNIAKGNNIDLGSSTNRDPLIEYVFTTPGTYLLRVFSFVHYPDNYFRLLDRVDFVSNA